MPFEKVTTCETCGKALTYKTKKPKWCAEHKPAGPKPYKKPKSAPTKSKKEAQMQRLLNRILPDAESIDNGYYSWLQSPKSAPMQLDRYYPELHLAFEYQGRQHYEYNSFMHSSQEAFAYLQTCDNLKAKLLKRRGIDLIAIKYDKDLSIGYLLRRLKEEGLLPRLRRATTVCHDDY